jgi:4-coumarate--CoA ligase
MLTGLPKGVMLTHQNVIVNLLQTDPVNDLSHDGGVDGKGDSAIAVLPFYHVYGELRFTSLKTPLLTLNRFAV